MAVNRTWELAEPHLQIKETQCTCIASRSEQLCQQMLKKNTTVSANLVKTEIDRRLMARKNNSTTTNYYVQVGNARVNTTDHSVSIVMKSTEEFCGVIAKGLSAHSNERHCDYLVRNPWLHVLIPLLPRVVFLSLPGYQDSRAGRHSGSFGCGCFGSVNAIDCPR